jgi:carbamoyl-phosphate synthase / aspartate carbamoyltransferase
LVSPPDATSTTSFKNIAWDNPNAHNLVDLVSTKTRTEYAPLHSCGLRVILIDVGVKCNQIRCFLERGVHVTVVPWDYDWLLKTDYDGLFISNGPGNPAILTTTIDHLRIQMDRANKPIFGICLGHQLLVIIVITF